MIKCAEERLQCFMKKEKARFAFEVSYSKGTWMYSFKSICMNYDAEKCMCIFWFYFVEYKEKPL